MPRTLSQILVDGNAYLSLDASIPTSTDLTTWSNFSDQAVRDASATAQFPEFHVIQLVATSTLASISLLSNYREMMAVPRVWLGGNNYDKYPEIKPLDRFDMDAGDKYCYVLGNPAEGYTAVFNNLTANATLSIDYQRYPSGLATLTDVCELPDDTYVVEKLKSYVLQSRTDDRFPTVEANANRKLQNMIGRSSKTPGGGVNTTPRVNTYRLGT